MPEAVHFLGRRDDVPNILRALDLSLLPSQGEPFGLVTVESMAVGTPPLVSSDGAGPELVQDGVTGRTLPQSSVSAWAVAAGELLRDREALRLMGERGPAATSRFRDEVHAGEMLAAYELAVHGPTPAPAGRGAVRAQAESDVEAPWPS